MSEAGMNRILLKVLLRWVRLHRMRRRGVSMARVGSAWRVGRKEIGLSATWGLNIHAIVVVGCHG